MPILRIIGARETREAAPIRIYISLTRIVIAETYFNAIGSCSCCFVWFIKWKQKRQRRDILKRRSVEVTYLRTLQIKSCVSGRCEISLNHFFNIFRIVAVDNKSIPEPCWPHIALLGHNTLNIVHFSAEIHYISSFIRRMTWFGVTALIKKYFIVAGNDIRWNWDLIKIYLSDYFLLASV